MSKLTDINPIRYVKHFVAAKRSRVSCISSGIFFLNLAITYKCNACCDMCGIWKIYRENPSKVDDELTLEDYTNFFTQNKKHLKELFHVGITGGEPFLRDDLADIVTLINSDYPRANIDIATNGLLPGAIGQNIERMYENSPDLRLQLNVSIDGLEEGHDKIRGIKGAFKKVGQTCELLTGIMEGRKNFNTTLSFTISPENYDQLYRAYLFARDRNFSFSCRPIHVSDVYYHNVSEGNSQGNSHNNPFSPEMIDDIEKQISKMPYDYRSFFMRHIPKFLRDPTRLIVPCYSGFHSMYVDPYGSAFPCMFINKEIGNIRDGKFFEKKWNSPSTIRTRENIKAGKCQNCWTECEVNKSIYLDGKSFALWHLKNKLG